MTTSWTARYPDLTGKAVIVAGDSPWIVEVVRGLAANGALLAIVAADRGIVDGAVRVAAALDAAVLGMTADPASATVWERLAPHIEQRLGPIDIAVAIAGQSIRSAVSTSLLPDMAARHRGVLIEIDATVEGIATAEGVRHRGIQCDPSAVTDDGIAATVLLCASDTVAAKEMILTLG